MLQEVTTRTRQIESYRSIVEESLLDELYSLASYLKGARVVHVNATSNGGGVAEILHSIIPLYRDLGIEASWQVIRGNDPFFGVTKQMHNRLQGEGGQFAATDWDEYMAWNHSNALELSSGHDVAFVHDPQPAALLQFARGAATHWVWRCHIDTSAPNESVWQVIAGLVRSYDALVFSVADFIGPGVEGTPVFIIPPAIDPMTPKNRPISWEHAAGLVAKFGVDPLRPFISQVSRFDPWKDPLGVIASFAELQERHPQLQLVMLGNFTDDDPEGPEVYQKVLKAAQEAPEVHIITDLTDMVSPFQSLSKVVVQKSLKEGFGLTVTEALWKGTPVVGGNVGGIRLQLGNGVGGYLVDSIQECTEKVDLLLTDEEQRHTLGKLGQEHVRSNFLLPRLLRDELRVMKRLLSSDGLTSDSEDADVAEGDAVR